MQDYIERNQPGHHVAPQKASGVHAPAHAGNFIICGQDIILDALSNYMNQAGIPSLRSYMGSYDALTALYKDDVQLASAHL